MCLIHKISPVFFPWVHLVRRPAMCGNWHEGNSTNKPGSFSFEQWGFCLNNLIIQIDVPNRIVNDIPLKPTLAFERSINRTQSMVLLYRIPEFVSPSQYSQNWRKATLTQ